MHHIKTEYELGKKPTNNGFNFSKIKIKIQLNLDLKNLQSSNEVVFKLCQFRHVRLNKKSSMKNFSPAGQSPEIETERSDQPDRIRRKLDVLQVFGNGNGFTGFGYENDDRFFPRKFSQERFDL